jgi:hypothetical protein
VNWYDPTQRIYILTTTIDPGKGYWLPSLSAGTLTLNEAPLVKAVAGPQETLPLASVRIAQGSSSKTLEFGFAANATDGFDRSLDKPVPPSSPYGQGLEAYFLSGDALFNHCSRDVRQAGTTARWMLEVANQAGLTLEWDVSAISSDLDVVLMANGKIIDMRSTRSLVLDRGGRFEISAGKGLIVPSDFSLSQNYPNPFNPETEIQYGLPQAAKTTMTVYNVLGQTVKVLVDEYQQAGTYTVQWNGLDNNGEQVATGIYFCKLEAGHFTTTMKMVLMK